MSCAVPDLPSAERHRDPAKRVFLTANASTPATASVKAKSVEKQGLLLAEGLHAEYKFQPNHLSYL